MEHVSRALRQLIDDGLIRIVRAAMSRFWTLMG
jgi:hypothetical protein